MMILSVLLWILFGALIGWIASLIMQTNSEQGPIADIFVGAAGAVIGGFIARTLGIGSVTGLNVPSFLIALGGAVLLLFIIRLVSPRY